LFVAKTNHLTDSILGMESVHRRYHHTLLIYFKKKFTRMQILYFGVSD